MPFFSNLTIKPFFETFDIARKSPESTSSYLGKLSTLMVFYLEKVLAAVSVPTTKKVAVITNLRLKPIDDFYFEIFFRKLLTRTLLPFQSSLLFLLSFFQKPFSYEDNPFLASSSIPSSTESKL